MTCAPSLYELLLMDREAVLSTRLVSSGHLTALRRFRRRTLFSNMQKDLMVGFATSSLLFDEVGKVDGACIVAASPLAGTPQVSAFLDGSSACSAVLHLPKLGASKDTAAEPHTPSAAPHGCREGSDRGVPSTPAHCSPRAIAAALRQDLDWHLVVLRYNCVLPMAHMACLGVLPQCLSVPEIVRRVVQPSSHIYIYACL